VVVHVDERVLAADGEGGCELENGSALAPETARRLACDASVVRNGRKSRTIPPSMRRALRARDGGCRFPGCTERRFVDAHHIEHWACGGRTDMSNLVQLCRRHHRLVHEGGFRIRRGANGTLAFHRPDGRLVLKAPRLRRGDRHELVARNRRAGVEVNDKTSVPRWHGDRLELVYAVDGLVPVDPRLAEPPPPTGVIST
jgi:hypothetical protein